LKKKEESNYLLNIAASVVIHAVIFFTAAVILHFTGEDTTMRSAYVEVTTSDFTQTGKTVEKEEPVEQKTEAEETPVENEPDIPEQPAEEPASGYLTLSEENLDTTGLKNIYRESTLNVKIKYPSGWTFLDQNRKNKLDGVTFWASKGIYDPPPYIHLEVKEKYLFNPARYKYKTEMDNYTAYFNDPVELSGQVSQEVYLVTGTDEDYSIKLIMQGQEAFKSFQPVFFGMLKTFEFGKAFF
jgi:hypothetical protein